MCVVLSTKIQWWVLPRINYLSSASCSHYRSQDWHWRGGALGGSNACDPGREWCDTIVVRFHVWVAIVVYMRGSISIAGRGEGIQFTNSISLWVFQQCLAVFFQRCSRCSNLAVFFSSNYATINLAVFSAMLQLTLCFFSNATTLRFFSAMLQRKGSAWKSKQFIHKYIYMYHHVHSKSWIWIANFFRRSTATANTHVGRKKPHKVMILLKESQGCNIAEKATMF